MTRHLRLRTLILLPIELHASLQSDNVPVRPQLGIGDHGGLEVEPAVAEVDHDVDVLGGGQVEHSVELKMHGLNYFDTKLSTKRAQ